MGKSQMNKLKEAVSKTAKYGSVYYVTGLKQDSNE